MTGLVGCELFGWGIWLNSKNRPPTTTIILS